MQFPYKNKIDKFRREICRFTGADEGGLPFPLRGASAKKMQAFSEPNGTESILHPHYAKKTHPKGCVCVVRMKGFEPTRLPTGT